MKVWNDDAAHVDLDVTTPPDATAIHTPALTGGVWIAYYPDWSGLVPFASEIDALRHAVAHNIMDVKFVLYGTDIRESK